MSGMTVMRLISQARKPVPFAFGEMSHMTVMPLIRIVCAIKMRSLEMHASMGVGLLAAGALIRLSGDNYAVNRNPFVIMC